MTRNSPPRGQSGFTLVEIAIVLVIIGLLLGGILKGQEMITQARIKNIANDFNGVTAAYFAYQDRYKAVPGDDLNATTTTRWPAAGAVPAVGGGDGNGQIAGLYGDSPAAAPTEALLFWWHLRRAGFVPGPVDGQGAWTQPNNAVGGIVGVQNNPLGLTGLAICSANVPDKIAGPLDTQLDDQRPNNGGLRAGAQPAGTANPTVAAVTAPAASYVEDGRQYLVCRNI